MKRLLALVAAVAMVGGAFLVRDVFIEGDGVDLPGGGGGGPTHVICATELEPVCDAMHERDGDFTFDVEDAGETADRLTADDFDRREADFDGWLTLDPWSELVDIRRDEDRLPAVFGETSEPLATTSLALIGPEERIDALVADCGDPPQWACLGEAADEPWEQHHGEVTWGEVDIGHADPTRHAAGLLVLGQAAAGFLERTDFASNDFSPEFRSWLRQLERADPGLATSSATPREELIRLPTASWDAVGDLDTADERDFAVVYPAPMLRASAVVAPLRGRSADVDDGDLHEALDAEGWEDEPAGDQPRAGALEALVRLWDEVTR